MKNRNWNEDDKFTDFANFDFRDEQQKRYQQEMQDQIFKDKVKEIMQIIDTDTGQHLIEKEKNPFVLVEVSRRVFDEMLSSSKERVLEMRDHMIQLEKYQEMKPEAAS